MNKFLFLNDVLLHKPTWLLQTTAIRNKFGRKLTIKVFDCDFIALSFTPINLRTRHIAINALINSVLQLYFNKTIIFDIMI